MPPEYRKSRGPGRQAGRASQVSGSSRSFGGCKLGLALAGQQADLNEQWVHAFALAVVVLVPCPRRPHRRRRSVFYLVHVRHGCQKKSVLISTTNANPNQGWRMLKEEEEEEEEQQDDQDQSS
ncbi:hypothetical protein M0802_001254 [Mischocyttarus mexicanus]|nr:hypothetical protein M0802_001254 [Mischocyttarus mexicanus]